MNAKRASQERQLLLSLIGNEVVAHELNEIADLLELQGANEFRVRAYRQAADTLRDLPRPVGELLDEEGVAGLIGLPTIGRSIAHIIEQIVLTGKAALLERLRGQCAPERLFGTVANIGPKLAERIHEELDIETLADLEAAAWDGRLARVPGMGQKRIRAVRESLAGRFRRQPGRSPATSAQAADAGDLPPVAELLDVDQQYRRLVRQDRLPKIAPIRMNPERKAWLPVLHTHRGERHYTVLFSNTAKAHELGKTRDWVVIYRDDRDNHGQWTVITSGFGRLKGRRIVRGREAECETFYAGEAPSA